MVRCNPDLERLSKHYLFTAIQQKRTAFMKEHPDAALLSLGIGDTTGPLAGPICDAMASTAKSYGTAAGYRGYGPDQGELQLRKRIAEKIYNGAIDPEEIFISDGSKCDAGRLQLLFGRDASVALQDPSYPAYLDSSLATGKEKIYPLPCTPENGFFPDLEKCPPADLLFFTSPNNPTGVAATRAQLEQLIAYARTRNTLILYDSAYSAFIRTPGAPKTIFEIEGAQQQAIEMGSFSKMAAFTGIRLGWTVVPRALKFSDGSPVIDQWKRVTNTFFNGASALAQQGGIAVLENEGKIQEAIALTMENCALLREALIPLGFNCYGGVDCPFLWISHQQWSSSWSLFDRFLNDLYIITTPGSGFGPSGEGFVRLSCFARREVVEECCRRLKGWAAELPHAMAVTDHPH